MHFRGAPKDGDDGGVAALCRELGAAVPTPQPRLALTGESLPEGRVVVVLDVKRQPMGTAYEVWTHNASRNTGKAVVAVAREAESLGAGEIVVNSIDNDGRMKGYDLTLATSVREATRLPLTVLGGAGLQAPVGDGAAFAAALTELRTPGIAAKLREKGIRLQLSVHAWRGYQPGDVAILHISDEDDEAWADAMDEMDHLWWQNRQTSQRSSLLPSWVRSCSTHSSR